MKKSGNKQVSLGFCPQHDIIVNNLTVKEHLIFYFALKMGKNYSDCRFEIRE